MVAQVYSGVEGIEKPEFGDWDTYSDRTDAYSKELRDWCRKHGKGKYKGKQVQLGVADGYAIYYILSLSPLVLVHDDSGDAYHYQGIEFFPVAQIRKLADQNDKRERLPLFGTT